MKQLLALTISLLLLGACTSREEEKAVPFEGQIKYSIILSESDAGIPADELERTIGTQMTAYFTEGKYLLEYNTSDSLGATRKYYFLEEGIGYTERENDKVIRKYPLLAPSGELTAVQPSTETMEILGDSCQSLTITYQSGVGTPAHKDYMATYYYSPKYPLNPAAYALQKEDFFDRFVAEAGAVFLRQEIVNYPHYNAIIQATDLQVKEIPESLFELDAAKDIVEQ